jgi:hypothetical protein
MTNEMDPQSLTQITADAPHIILSPQVFAAAIALSFGLIKLLELTLTALIKKYKPEKPQQVVVEFDPEMQKRIADMDEKLNSMSNVLSRTDNDGTPMVYSSRSMVETIREIAVIIRNVSATQERLAHVMDRLEQKFSDHDRSDSIVQTQINQTLERLMRAFDDHDKRVHDAIAMQSEILETVRKE